MKGKKGFQKGISGNPTGKKKGTTDYVTQLNEALKKYEIKYKESFLDNFIKRSRESDTMASVLLKKMLPDTHEIGGPGGGAIEIKDARSKLFDRFNALAKSREKKASDK